MARRFAGSRTEADSLRFSPIMRPDHGGLDAMPGLARDRLIVALDMPGLDQARDIVRELGDTVAYYKVGPHLFEKGLIDFIEQLIADEKHVFLDFKSVDIGDTMRGMASKVSRLGVRFLTVMGTTSTIRAAKEGLEGSPIPKILVVTVLTDQDEADIQAEYGAGKTVGQLVIDRALMAANAGADGVICSPKEIEAVRRAVPRPGFLIITPGVRPAGTARDDQKRVATPAEAIRNGADYLVIGRPIIRPYDHDRPAAARRVIDEMQAALDGPPRLRAVG
jgi:orotidine-5'-phosphate decarboxylase